jgi:peroxiredoxin
MKNYMYLPISLLILLISCSPNNDQSKIVLNTSGYPDSTKIYLWKVETESSDSGYIINNNLVFSADVDEPTRFNIRTVFKTRAEFEIKYFWKENTLLTISAEKGNMKNAKFEGSVIQIQANGIDTIKNQLQQKNISLRQEYDNWDKDDKEGRLAIRKKGNEITQSIKDVEINYVKNNPDELLSAITLNQLKNYTIPKDKTQELYENLSLENKSTKYGMNVKNFLDTSHDLKVGDQAIKFQLPDLNGNLVGLDDFKGKYILLDFWGSNCGACRMGNPNILNNYKAYREKGFEIISISFDKNKESWANAVEKDSMIWTTVCDLKGTNGDVIMAYNAYLMPTYYLIDPNGVIIYKHLGPFQFDEILKDIFPN